MNDAHISRCAFHAHTLKTIGNFKNLSNCNQICKMVNIMGGGWRVNRYLFLFLHKDQNDRFINILGKLSGDTEITFKRRAGFFEALNMSDQPRPPSNQNFPFVFLSLQNSSIDSFQFDDPQITERILFTFQSNSIVIDTGEELSADVISGIFQYLLIKKDNRILFLTEFPKNKFNKRRSGN